jgi:hypothetical protein
MTAYAISFARERVVIAADTVFYLPDRQAAAPRILGYGTKGSPACASSGGDLRPWISQLNRPARRDRSAVRDLDYHFQQ